MVKNNENNLNIITNVSVKIDNALKPSDNLGITQEYTGNRNLWDSDKSKKEFKEGVFGDNKTIVDEDGIVLHSSHKAAKKKYRRGYAKHAAEVDHEISLEYLHGKAKNNPFLSNNDLKEIANSHENYQVISKSKNASKGANNSANLLTHAKIHGKFAVRTVKNINGEFVSGALESVNESKNTVLQESAEKLLNDGESIKDTLKYAGGRTAEIAVKGGSERVISDLKNSSEKVKEKVKKKTGTFINEKVGDSIGGRVLSRTSDKLYDSAYTIMSNSIERLLIEGESLGDTLAYAGEEFTETAVKEGSEILLDELKKSAIEFFENSNNPALNSSKAVIENITKNDSLGRIIVFAKSCGEALLKFADGEITGEQFAEEIMINGMLTFVSSAITTICPVPFVGPLIAGFVAKTAEVILNTKAHMDDYLIKEQMIHNLSVEAQAEMEHKRLEFHDKVQKEFDNWDSATEEAFNQIISNSFDESFSLDKMINGLDKILSLCGEEAEFHSINEWENNLDIPLILSF